jgi:hypothetical protein
MPPTLPNFGSPSRIILPPFVEVPFKVDRQRILDSATHNPHPTDVLLDTSVFSLSRLPLVRDILQRFSPILLPSIRQELEDLKLKPELRELRDIVFPGGTLSARFRGDDIGLLKSYSRFVVRYASLLRSRREVINTVVRRAVEETGVEPVGKARAKMIQNLLSQGLASTTIKLANKDYRRDRWADEVLAVFAVLSPIATGRDCFLFTADEDVSEQVLRMSHMIFDDYGAYLMAKDFRADESRYSHRHRYKSDLFTGDVVAVGRMVHPDYLLPPPMLVKTCSTTVVDVGRLKGFTWISARNMEPALAFQEQDPLGRKGDPGGDMGIVFTLPNTERVHFKCDTRHHFAIGTPVLVKPPKDGAEQVSVIDLLRAIADSKPPTGRRLRIQSPFAEHQRRLLDRAFTKMRKR